MPPLLPTGLSVAPVFIAYCALSVVVLLWNVVLAGQIAQARRQSRDFLAATALCGLLIVPAVIIAVTSSSILTGRPIGLVTWLWPATLGLFVVQSGIALRRHLVTSLLSVPIFVANLLLFLAALARYGTQVFPMESSAMLGVHVAHVTALSLAFGKAALWSPLAIQLPLLAPAYPARWRVSKSIRALFALSAGAGAALILVEYPRGVRAAATFSDFRDAALQERPRGDLALGVKILPTLRGAPAQISVSSDLSLVDSLQPAMVSVVLDPAATTPQALDSLENVLAGLRSDSILIVASLGYGDADATAFRASPSAYLAARLNVLDRLVRSVRPDVVLPADDPLTRGASALGGPPTDWWTDYLRQASRLTKRLRPRTRVAVSVGSFGARDSVFYSWAARSTDIDIVGFSFAPSFSGGAALAAQHRVAARWLKGQRKAHWVTGARTYPFVFGETNQRYALIGTLAWATRQPRVYAVIVDGAGDYDALTGLRTTSGRLRPAVMALARARQAIKDAELAVR